MIIAYFSRESKPRASKAQGGLARVYTITCADAHGNISATTTATVPRSTL
jgi:hypothetical protein